MPDYKGNMERYKLGWDEDKTVPGKMPLGLVCRWKGSGGEPPGQRYKERETALGGIPPGGERETKGRVVRDELDKEMLIDAIRLNVGGLREVTGRSKKKG